MTFRKWRALKRVRVQVSLAVLAVLTFLFCDIRHFSPSGLFSAVSAFQLVPSLLRTVYTGSLIALTGTAIILLSALVAGRLYCSSLCPIGTFQDLLTALQRRLGRVGWLRRRRGDKDARRSVHPRYFRYRRPLTWLQYGLLVVAAAGLFAGTTIPLTFFEPFSNYGRLLTSTAVPSLVASNNTVSWMLGKAGIYVIYAISQPGVVPGLLTGTLMFVGLLFVLTRWHGRLFCNTLCPAGAILGLTARYSAWKIVVNHDHCNECGACERVCKAECILSGSKQVDFSSCVGCLNCLASCPTGGIEYRFSWGRGHHRGSESRFSEGRRMFLAQVTLPAAGVLAAGQDPRDHRIPPTPPGSRTLDRFTGLCTACHACVTACPTKVLTPSFLEYGTLGMFQPMMNYSSGYCNYDCTICGEVCPTGAIRPLDIATKKLVQIGKAVFVKEECVVVAKKKDCAACSEHCPTKAVHTIPYQDGLFLPELTNDICIGCGACEHACPTVPRKAISVASNREHGTAKKPEPSKQQQKLFDQNQDFPF